MALGLGELAPDFCVVTTKGKINLHEFIGSNWGILFTLSKAFTPMCSNELKALASLKGVFEEKDITALGLSINDLASHKNRIKEANKLKNMDFPFPIIADYDKRISKILQLEILDFIDDLKLSYVFIIGEDKRIKLALKYPVSKYRDFMKLLSTVESLRASETRTPPSMVPLLVPPIASLELCEM